MLNKDLNVMICPELLEQVNWGAVLAVSVSGGKDSQAMLNVVMNWYRANNLTNKIFAIHADLGRAEWAQTAEFTAQMCAAQNIELVTVRAEHEGKPIDLLDRINLRQAQLKEKGREDVVFFPSFQQRYCTSDMKTDPLNAHFKKFERVVSIEGIRWEESKARAKKPIFERRNGMKQKGGALGFTWNPIVHFSFADVLGACGMSEEQYRHGRLQYQLTETIPADWKIHPAYAIGNDRLSCSICVLGSRNDVKNGIKHNPEFAEYLLQKEKETGFTYQQGFSIHKALEQMQAGKNQGELFT